MTTETLTNQPAEVLQEDTGAEVGTTQDQELDAAQSDAELDADGNPVQQEPDDTEEVEHEGKKYRIPKAIKPALLMQADYTRKTQELAEQRRSFEAATAERQQAIANEARVMQTLVSEHAKLVALDQQIEHYQAVNWQGAMAADPTSAQAAWMQYQQLKEQRAGVAHGIETTKGQRLAEIEAQKQQRLAAEATRLAESIPNWSGELSRKLSATGRDVYGFTEAELAQINDSRAVRLLHDAYQYQQLIKSAGANPTAKATVQAQPAIKQAQPVPVATLPAGGTGHVKTLSDPGLSTDEWMRRREAQLKKRKG